jgi:Toxin PAAR-like domain
MGISVYANGMGLFHKSSGGSGKAFPDVCLSPPPPPTGPVPIPYPNSLQASDLTKGTKTVKIQGSETAIEDGSYVSTSSGDEGGTQGGSVVTHKTKGKGYFTLWSFDVKAEGKGVDRHGDPMGQNCASTPPSAADIMAMVAVAVREALYPEEPCAEAYDSEVHHRFSMTPVQYGRVANGPCWTCGSTSPLGNNPPGTGGTPIPNTGTPPAAFTPDHEPPMMVRWYAGGCHDYDPNNEAAWIRDFRDPRRVFPHCAQCSDGQGGLSWESQDLAARHAELLSGSILY